jgi:AraC family L-rhamnose operon regulatory protein RhaS
MGAMSDISAITSCHTMANDRTWSIPIRTMPLRESVPESTSAFALIWCAQGAAVLDVDGLLHPLAAPALVPLGPGCRLALRQADNLGGWRIDFDPSYLNNHITLEFLDSGAEAPNQSTKQDIYLLAPFLEARRGPVAVFRPGVSAEARFGELFRQTHTQLVEQPYFWPCRVRTCLLEIILLLGSASRLGDDDPAATRSGPGEWGVAEQVLLAIQMNYGQDLTLDSLARMVNSNRTSVNSLFQRRYGQSVHAYLKHYRLEVAELLLRDSHLPIPEIMERVGWSNGSSFTRSFREAWGNPPGEYRRLNLQFN